jgi:hypothetical protein
LAKAHAGGVPGGRRPAAGGTGAMQEKAAVPGLRTELLFEMSVDLVEEAQVVGATPHGIRRIRHIKGGSFSGPKIAGEVLPGGADWLLVRADGAREIDVRVTLRADDGHLIYAISRGIFDVSPAVFERILQGEAVDPAQYYFRTTPLFETASEKYGWLNRIVAVSIGRQAAPAVVQQTIYTVL